MNSPTKIGCLLSNFHLARKKFCLHFLMFGSIFFKVNLRFFLLIINLLSPVLFTPSVHQSKIRNITPSLFLLPLLKYILETFQKLLFHNNKTSYGSWPSRYHNRYYNIIRRVKDLEDLGKKMKHPQRS